MVFMGPGGMQQMYYVPSGPSGPQGASQAWPTAMPKFPGPGPGGQQMMMVPVMYGPNGQQFIQPGFMQPQQMQGQVGPGMGQQMPTGQMDGSQQMMQQGMGFNKRGGSS